MTKVSNYMVSALIQENIQRSLPRKSAIFLKTISVVEGVFRGKTMYEIILLFMSLSKFTEIFGQKCSLSGVL